MIRRSASPVRTIRERAYGAATSGRTSFQKRSSWCTSSATGQMKTRCTPAFANAVNFSANSSGGPIGRRSRSISSGRCTVGIDPLFEDAVGFGAVVGDVAPHRRQRVRERVGSLPVIGQLRAEGLATLRRTAPASCCTRMPASRRRDGPRDEARRRSPSSPPRSAVRTVARAGVPTTDPRSSRSGRRTAHRLARHSARSAPIASSNRCQRSEKSRPTAA